jgi:hypothetical protein
MNVPAYKDPNHEGNGSKYLTGKLCIEGCGRPAGTLWGPYWCRECNALRIDRISISLNTLLEEGKVKK